jgi:hypothetical protein
MTRLGANSVIFILFFGISLLEAFQSHQWLKAFFWLAIGFVFLRADLIKPRV